jgi:hypothetical protein
MGQKSEALNTVLPLLLGAPPEYAQAARHLITQLGVENLEFL